MSVRVDSNTNEVILRVTSNAEVAIRMFLEDVHKNSTEITPMRTGELRKRIRKSVSGKTGEIQWQSNYAIYQENPSRKFKYTTPGTGPHYAEKAVKKAVDNFSKIISEVGE